MVMYSLPHILLISPTKLEEILKVTLNKDYPESEFTLTVNFNVEDVTSGYGMGESTRREFTGVTVKVTPKETTDGQGT